MAYVLVIIAMGLVTYATRLLPMQLANRARIPLWVQQALRYVPTAVLAAILVPEIVQSGGVLDFSWGNARLLAALVAAAVAWRTRNVLATVGAGMIALWLLQALLTYGVLRERKPEACDTGGGL